MKVSSSIHTLYIILHALCSVCCTDQTSTGPVQNEEPVKRKSCQRERCVTTFNTKRKRTLLLKEIHCLVQANKSNSIFEYNA